MTLPVILVDDHRLIATTVVLALRREGLEAQWFTAPGPELERALEELGPGLVLLDLDLGTDEAGDPIDGAGLVRGMSAAGWTVLVVSSTTDQVRLADALAEGAESWIGKDAPFEQLVDTCLRAARGERVLDPDTRRGMLAARRAGRSAERERLRRLEKLTPRELEVLAALADGARVGQIAKQSVVSVATVRSQVSAIRAKLGVASQLEAAALYRASR